MNNNIQMTPQELIDFWKVLDNFFRLNSLEKLQYLY